MDLEISSKLRPCGMIIGIDNSDWEDHLEDSENLPLHAVLHDAAGFAHEHSKTRPGCFTMSNKQLLNGPRQWNFLLLSSKT